MKKTGRPPTKDTNGFEKMYTMLLTCMDRFNLDQESPPLWFPDRGLTYSAWYRRERAARRHRKPGPQPCNVGTTPRGFDYSYPVRSLGPVARVLGGLLR